MDEPLSGPCTAEIADFDGFSGLIGNPEATGAFDHVIFDPSPTGHTLRLISRSKAWDPFLDHNKSGISCRGPLAGLEKQRAVHETAIATRADASATTLILVSRPQLVSPHEEERTSIELRTLGVCNQRLVLNGVFETNYPEDVTAQALQQRGLAALELARPFIDSLPGFIVPLRPNNILGLDGLRALLEDDREPPSGQHLLNDWTPPDMESLETLVADIEKRGGGVIMTMGKGGVGKTTVAAAIAVMLAQRGHAVHLSTTDPAAHVAQTLAGQIDGLTV